MREGLFAHLDALVNNSSDGTLNYRQIERFNFHNENFTIRQTYGRGISKPRNLDAALSITTTYTAPGKIAPYADFQGEDGFPRYKYEGDDPNLYTNSALRTCLNAGLPLVYFVGVAQGIYQANYPVYIVGESMQTKEFILNFEVNLPNFDISLLTPAEKKYAMRQTKARIHQPLFRQQVMAAYKSTCAVCRLKHHELLDAAHIIEDSDPRGEPIVTNGLALCKIHHAAFDKNLLGISPNYQVRINSSLLEEVDGPMLKHGLQEMNGVTLTVPSSKFSRPDSERLEIRFQDFLEAS